MNVFLFDEKSLRNSFLPLTYTRSVADLHFGLFNSFERWSWLTQNTPKLYTDNVSLSSDDLLVSSHVVVTKELIVKVDELKENSSLWYGDFLVARRGGFNVCSNEIRIDVDVVFLESLWDLIAKGGGVLAKDLELIRKRSYGKDLEDKKSVIYGKKTLFIGEDVSIRSVIFNLEKGPIYIGDGAKINEGTVIYGPAVIGANTVVTPNSKLLGDVYLGEKCVVGGEVKRSYIHANSNKAHEGYMGDSILGEWCNLGAGTNISNLKNNFGEIKMWSYDKKEIVSTNRMKAGVLMGDYCKTAIGSRINSGTTMGVGTVIFSSELTHKYYSNFSWGDKRFDFDKFMQSAKVMWKINEVSYSDEAERNLNLLYLKES